MFNLQGIQLIAADITRQQVEIVVQKLVPGLQNWVIMERHDRQINMIKIVVITYVSIVILQLYCTE